MRRANSDVSIVLICTTLASAGGGRPSRGANERAILRTLCRVLAVQRYDELQEHLQEVFWECNEVWQTSTAYRTVSYTHLTLPTKA